MFSRRTKTIAVAIIIAGFAFSMFTPAAAATYVPSVKQGDYWKYDARPTFGGQTATLEYKVEVTSVSGTVVSLRLTVMTMIQSWTIDVTNSSLVLNNAFVVAGGLSVGDPITPGNSVNFTSSSTRTYAGGSRTVNYAEASAYEGFFQCYFDKQTGILCEAQITGAFSGSLILKETNLWLNVTLMIIIVAVGSGIAVAVVAGVILYRRRRGK